MKIETLKALNDARKMRKAVAVVSNLSSGEEQLIFESDQDKGALAQELEKAFTSGIPRTVQAGDEEYFINTYLPPVRIIVIGAVHITQSLAQMAVMAGFDLHVIDPRTAFATPERFENVKLSADWPEEVLGKETPLDAYCAMVAITHDPKIDDYPLLAALKADCFYVGALGSRKTHAKRVERLKEQGADDDMIAKIHAPIGLDIGAANPQEIAIAIMAQIIAELRQRGGAR